MLAFVFTIGMSEQYDFCVRNLKFLDANNVEVLKYILRPPLSTERLLPGPDGLVRIALKKPFSDGTVAVDLDPLSLLCRLVALVPAPRFLARAAAANAPLGRHHRPR